MERREFVQRLTFGLVAGWAFSRGGWLQSAQAAPLPPRLALLADAHLKDGDTRRAEAQALARAVAEIRRAFPAPDLVLFAGDLAHAGNTKALALGKEILADLPAPLVAVMGEGDGFWKGAAVWPRLFGEPRFSYVFPGSPDNQDPLNQNGRDGNLHSSLLRKTENRKQKTVLQILGLHTSLSPSPQGPVFQVGREQRGWLARELARLDPNLPLIILSHAPLARIFRPWQQWTADAAEVVRLLTPFPRVLCVHGHIHRHAGFKENFASHRLATPPPPVGGGWGERDFSTPTLTLPPQEGGKKMGAGYLRISHCGLAATAWPLPSPCLGTPAAPGPGLGPQGCGWGLLSAGGDSLKFQPQVWQA
ncbi:MAG: hypothetical protein A2Z73_01150 [Deltaproteobacteria bacterium RBG_13_60_28]|nr:MAG: hypothetical protein A2Z73_01150 [Deltaproteobacteria bacterium RBG_13_60_28]